MPEIEVDEEVYHFLQQQARPFEEITPNQVLRRLLGIEKFKSLDEEKSNKLIEIMRKSLSIDGLVDLMLKEVTVLEKNKKKKPKTDCRELIKSGYLKEGQELYLLDYKGKVNEGYHATLHGNSLIKDNKQYSLSKLAQKYFDELGYSSTAVRGPAHWSTNKGETVQMMWEQYLIDLG
jgi:hypothetical protein